ncbi:hypothetical protein PR048_020239, partial [Dryococelus australis]
MTRKKNNPFILFEMGHDKFIDVKYLTNQTHYNFVVNTQNGKVPFNNFSNQNEFAVIPEGNTVKSLQLNSYNIYAQILRSTMFDRQQICTK